MEKIDLKAKTLEELEQFVLINLKEKRFRASQIFHWLHQKNVTSFAAMKNLPQALQESLDQAGYITNLTPVLCRQSKDGTKKYLFQLDDDQLIESVYLPDDLGRRSICISSQVGCKMGCSFCATGQGGWVRNLRPGEIIDQIYAVQRDLQVKISNVVFMGMGEPLLNYDAVLRAIRQLNHPQGGNIGIRRITLSTCGLVPQIRRLANEELQFVLAVSLHAPNDQIRNKLMPINQKYPLDELLKACQEYIQITRRRVTFEYALISGVNDSFDCANQLAKLLQGLLCHVNLIPINPIEGTNLQKPGSEKIQLFQEMLGNAGIEATCRKERGADIDAACGQLRARAGEVVI